jgi:hypothetical protein
MYDTPSRESARRHLLDRLTKNLDSSVRDGHEAARDARQRRLTNTVTAEHRHGFAGLDHEI